jgi:xanthine dehydrogenase YagR molybdenum-binding subunit
VARFFANQKEDALAVTAGRVHLKENAPETGVPFEEILRKSNIRAASGQGRSTGTFGDPNRKFSTHSFGA